MSRRIVIGIFVLRLATLAIQAEGAEIRIGTPDEVVRALRAGTSNERQGLAHNLGLASFPGGGGPCSEFEDVELRKPTLVRGSESALITAWSAECDDAFLIVLTRTSRGWTSQGVMPLWTKYGKPEIRCLSLIRPDESEIIVTNQGVDSGTGVFQRNMTVFKIIDGGLRVIFDEPESLNVSVPTTIQGKHTNTDEHWTSTFTIEDASSDAPALKYIAEQKKIRVRGTSIEVRRNHIWRPELGVFRTYGTGLKD